MAFHLFISCQDLWPATGQLQRLQQYPFGSKEMLVPRRARCNRSFHHITHPRCWKWNGEINGAKIVQWECTLWFSSIMIVQLIQIQVTSETSHLSDRSDSVCFAEIQVNKVDTSDSTVGNKPPVWPTVSVILRRMLVSACEGSNWRRSAVRSVWLEGKDTQTYSH